MFSRSNEHCGSNLFPRSARLNGVSDRGIGGIGEPPAMPDLDGYRMMPIDDFVVDGAAYRRLVRDPAGERGSRLRRTAALHPARRQRDRPPRRSSTRPPVAQRESRSPPCSARRISRRKSQTSQMIVPDGCQGCRVVSTRNYPASENEASAQFTGMSGGVYLVCTITMAAVEELGTALATSNASRRAEYPQAHVQDSSCSMGSSRPNLVLTRRRSRSSRSSTGWGHRWLGRFRPRRVRFPPTPRVSPR